MQHKTQEVPEVPVVSERLVAEINNTCVLMRTRLIARVLTGIYDEELRPFAIGSPQFILLMIIAKIGPATRADIGRFHHQDRSTLTRNLKIILSEGWAEEIQDKAGGRGKPIVLTKAGGDLVRDAEPAWRMAQSRAKALLGKEGVNAIVKVAKHILNPPATA